jgi:teichuronic acid biosynthesis glycosyltransferase TuaC
MSIRVLVISHMYPNPVNPISGIFVHNQVKALTELGIQIHVVSPIPSFPIYQKWQKYRHVPIKKELDGVPVYYVPTFMFPGGLFFSFYGTFYIRSLREKLEHIKTAFPFQLIHCHTVFPDGYAGGILKEIFQVPIIITVHGSDMMIYPKRSRSVYRKTKHALARSDQVITVSQRLLTEARNMVPHIKGNTVYNGFNPKLFYPVDQQEARIKLKVMKTGKKILFVGNLLPVKGVSDLIKAFSQVALLYPNVHLHIVGDGPLRSSLEDLVRKFKLCEKVTFLGQRPYNEIPLWINSADVIVLSSLSEGLPSILLETMACGKIMIATDVGGVGEILQHKKTGYLVSPQDVDGLAEYLRKVIMEEENITQMGEAAYQIAQQWTWQKNAQYIQKLYGNILNRDTKNISTMLQ